MDGDTNISPLDHTDGTSSGPSHLARNIFDRIGLETYTPADREPLNIVDDDNNSEPMSTEESRVENRGGVNKENEHESTTKVDDIAQENVRKPAIVSNPLSEDFNDNESDDKTAPKKKILPLIATRPQDMLPVLDDQQHQQPQRREDPVIKCLFNNGKYRCLNCEFEISFPCAFRYHIWKHLHLVDKTCNTCEGEALEINPFKVTCPTILLVMSKLQSRAKKYMKKMKRERRRLLESESITKSETVKESKSETVKESVSVKREQVSEAKSESEDVGLEPPRPVTSTALDASPRPLLTPAPPQPITTAPMTVPSTTSTSTASTPSSSVLTTINYPIVGGTASNLLFTSPILRPILPMPFVSQAQPARFILPQQFPAAPIFVSSPLMQTPTIVPGFTAIPMTVASPQVPIVTIANQQQGTIVHPSSVYGGRPILPAVACRSPPKAQNTCNGSLSLAKNRSPIIKDFLTGSPVKREVENADVKTTFVASSTTPTKCFIPIDKASGSPGMNFIVHSVESLADRSGGQAMFQSPVKTATGSPSASVKDTANVAQSVPTPSRHSESFVTAQESHLAKLERSNGQFYVCGVGRCSFATGMDTSFAGHIFTMHSFERTLPCVYCQSTFMSQELLVEHIKRHSEIATDVKPYCCHECDYSSNIMAEYRAHYNRVHKELQRHVCKHCQEVFTDTGDLWGHLVESYVKIVHCAHCRVSNSNRSLVIKHIKEQHPGQPKRFTGTNMMLCQEKRRLSALFVNTCSACGQYSTDLTSLRKHLEKCGQYKQVNTHSRVQCADCNAVFKNQLDLVKHSLRGHALSYLECPGVDCDFSSSNPTKFHLHCLQHEGFADTMTVYECSGCNVKSNLRAFVRVHVTKTHRDSSSARIVGVERRHSSFKESQQLWHCSKCRLFFPKGASKAIAVHQEEHERRKADDVKMERCPQCEFKSDCLHSLYEHVVRQHDGRTDCIIITLYACIHCAVRSTDKEFVVAHVKSSHPKAVQTCDVLEKKIWTSPIGCPVCKFSCMERELESGLIPHINAHHVDLAEKLTLKVRSSYGCHDDLQASDPIEAHEIEFPCQHCDFSGLVAEYREHVVTHFVGERTFSWSNCASCHFQAKSAALVTRHSKNVHMISNACSDRRTVTLVGTADETSASSDSLTAGPDVSPPKAGASIERYHCDYCAMGFHDDEAYRRHSCPVGDGSRKAHPMDEKTEAVLDLKPEPLPPIDDQSSTDSPHQGVTADTVDGFIESNIPAISDDDNDNGMEVDTEVVKEAQPNASVDSETPDDRCPHCPFTSKKPCGLRIHMVKMHKDAESAERKEPAYRRGDVVPTNRKRLMKTLKGPASVMRQTQLSIVSSKKQTRRSAESAESAVSAPVSAPVSGRKVARKSTGGAVRQGSRGGGDLPADPHIAGISELFPPHFYTTRETGEYDCALCDRCTKSLPDKFFRHAVCVHLGLSPYWCTTCGFSGMERSCVIMHCRIEHGNVKSLLVHQFLTKNRSDVEKAVKEFLERSSDRHEQGGSESVSTAEVEATTAVDNDDEDDDIPTVDTAEVPEDAVVYRHPVVSESRQEDSKKYTCTLCCLVIHDETKARKHARKKHQKPFEEVFEAPADPHIAGLSELFPPHFYTTRETGEYDCALCDRCTISRPDKLFHHVLYVHLGLFPYWCTKCEFRRMRMSSVVEHCRVEHGNVELFLAKQQFLTKNRRDVEKAVQDYCLKSDSDRNKKSGSTAEVGATEAVAADEDDVAAVDTAEVPGDAIVYRHPVVSESRQKDLTKHTCTVCRLVIQDETKARKHASSKHQKPFEEVFETVSRKIATTVFKCSACDDYESLSPQEVIDHYGLRHNDLHSYTCCHCETQLPTLKALCVHTTCKHQGLYVEIARPTEKKQPSQASRSPIKLVNEFKCPECPFTRSSSYLVRSHIRSEHSVRRQDGVFQCFYCSYTADKMAEVVEHHESLHEEERLERLAVIVEKSSASRKRNGSPLAGPTKKARLGDSTPPRTASPRGTDSQSSPAYARRSGGENLVCPKCPTPAYTTTVLKDMRKHIMRHITYQPYQCKSNGCKTKAYTEHAIIKHFRSSHSGEPKFKAVLRDVHEKLLKKLLVRAKTMDGSSGSERTPDKKNSERGKTTPNVQVAAAKPSIPTKGESSSPRKSYMWDSKSFVTYFCLVCDYKCDANYNLMEKHFQTKHKGHKLTALAIHRHNRQQFEPIISKKDGRLRLTCGVCQFRCGLHTEFRKHWREHLVMNWRCGYCGVFEGADKQEVLYHCRVDHPGISNNVVKIDESVVEEKPTVTNLKFCSRDGEQLETSENGIVYKAKKNGDFGCSKCFFSDNEWKGLEDHYVRWHKPRYRCESCSFKVRDLPDMVKHIKANKDHEYIQIDEDTGKPVPGAEKRSAASIKKETRDSADQSSGVETKSAKKDKNANLKTKPKRRSRPESESAEHFTAEHGVVDTKEKKEKNDSLKTKAKKRPRLDGESSAEEQEVVVSPRNDQNTDAKAKKKKSSSESADGSTTEPEVDTNPKKDKNANSKAKTISRLNGIESADSSTEEEEEKEVVVVGPSESVKNRVRRARLTQRILNETSESELDDDRDEDFRIPIPKKKKYYVSESESESETETLSKRKKPEIVRNGSGAELSGSGIRKKQQQEEEEVKPEQPATPLVLKGLIVPFEITSESLPPSVNESNLSYRCPYCPERLGNELEFGLHTNRHIKLGKSVAGKTADGLDRGLSTAKRLYERYGHPYYCCKCGRSFFNLSSAKTHVTASHRGPSKVNQLCFAEGGEPIEQISVLTFEEFASETTYVDLSPEPLRESDPELRADFRPPSTVGCQPNVLLSDYRKLGPSEIGTLLSINRIKAIL